MGILEALKAFVQKGRTLYFPGCTTAAKLPHIAENYKALLTAAGINFITLRDTVCCGGFCLDAGYHDDFELCRQKNMELFTEQQVGRIITSDPHCFSVFKEHYSLPVVYAPVLLLEKLNVLVTRSGTVKCHDSCFFQSNEMRSLLQKTGFKLVESTCAAQCCGAGGLLSQNNPQLAKRMAERFIKGCSCDKIVTQSPICYLHLKDKGKEVLELSEVLG